MQRYRGTIGGVMSVLGIMPTYMTKEEHMDLTVDAILSWAETTKEAELLVVDDCSPFHMIDDFGDWVENKSYASFVARPENGGFSKAVNVGLRKALDEKRDAVLVNADIEFRWDGWLEAMLGTEADIVGALLTYPNGLIQHAGIYFSVLTRDYNHLLRFSPHDLPAAQIERECPVTAALQLISYECLAEYGIYDEDFKLGWEDVEYCVRVLQGGGKCVYQPRAKAVHHESVFRASDNGSMSSRERDSFATLQNKLAGTSLAGIVPMVLGEKISQ